MPDLGSLRGQSVAVGRVGGPTPNTFVVDSAIDDTAVLRPTTSDGRLLVGDPGRG